MGVLGWRGAAAVRLLGGRMTGPPRFRACFRSGTWLYLCAPRVYYLSGEVQVPGAGPQVVLPTRSAGPTVVRQRGLAFRVGSAQPRRLCLMF